MSSLKEKIKKVIELTGYSIGKVKIRREQDFNQISFNDFLSIYFSGINRSDFFFVQIGANDGVTNDPIHSFITKYQLKGIAIEPQKDVFSLLQETYREYPRVECLNIAIGSDVGTHPFYFAKTAIRTDENFSRLTGISSFDKNAVRRSIRNKIPKNSNPDDFIEESFIDTVQLETVLVGRGVAKIDLLQIDCEGYDYEILKTINLEKYAPTVVNIESHFMNDSDRAECQKMFESLGYKWFNHRGDMCAYKI